MQICLYAYILITYVHMVNTYCMYILMCSLCALPLHSGFFIPGFPKLFVWFENHDRSCQKCIPKLNKHLRKRNIEPSHYCTAWFFKLFLDTVSVPEWVRERGEGGEGERGVRGEGELCAECI